MLADVERAGVDLVVSGGDLAAGPMPHEVIERSRSLALPVRYVRGNGDRELVAIVDGTSAGPEVGAADAWTAGRLTRDDRDLLASFEETVTVDVTGLGRVLVCHGSPRSDEEIVTAVTSEERLARILAEAEERVVVCGHTHHQFDRQAGRVRVVNAGSVGLPYEGRRGAFWALLGPDVELRSSEYDVEAAVAAMRATGSPSVEEVFAENLLSPPSAEEVAAFFEQMALDMEAADGA